MTKQEKIQEAYGIYWNDVKDGTDEDGWIPIDNVFEGSKYAQCYENIEVEFSDDNDYWRPIILMEL